MILFTKYIYILLIIIYYKFIITFYLLYIFPLFLVSYRTIGIIGREFANGPGDQGSIPS